VSNIEIKPDPYTIRKRGWQRASAARVARAAQIAMLSQMLLEA